MSRVPRMLPVLATLLVACTGDAKRVGGCEQNTECPAGWICREHACEPEPGRSCPNGRLDAGEACDDGNDYDNDACLSTCVDASCGDGFLWDREEACDRGANQNDGAYGGCNADCSLAPRCGDGIVQAGQEVCDDTGESAICDLDCTASRCGDGVLNTTAGEACDFGSAYNRGDYGGCEVDCTLAPYCGDDAVEPTYEACDDAGESMGCDPDCTLPECGDGYHNATATEECDLGTINNDGAYGGCNSDCSLASYCGDEIEDPSFEECDEGTAKNLGGYEGCNADCSDGPYCGDGTVDAADGETCDTTAVGGSCADCVLTCFPGFDDCNADPLDGCETDLENEQTRCGTCHTDCSPKACVGGSCQP